MRGFRKKWMAPVKIQESIRDINYLILCPVFGVLISKSKMIYCFLLPKIRKTKNRRKMVSTENLRNYTT